MDTNLKKGKKIRAFCYRMIAVGALVMAIATALFGREAVINAFREGPDTLRGDICSLTEFKEYVARLSNTALVAYAGCGDDDGHALTDEYAQSYSEEMRKELDVLLNEAKPDMIFYLKSEADDTEISNVDYPLFSEYDGHLMLPEGAKVCYVWEGRTGEAQFFDTRMTALAGKNRYLKEYFHGQYGPNQEKAEWITMVLAVNGSLRSERLDRMAWTARQYQRTLIVILVGAALWLVFGMLSICTGKAWKQAKAEYGIRSGKIWLELKLVLIAAVAWTMYCSEMPYLMGGASSRLCQYEYAWIYFLIGCLCYLYVLDFRQNGWGVFANSLPVKCYCTVKEFVQAQPWYRRAMALCFATLVGALLLLTAGLYMCYIPSAKFYMHPDVAKKLVGFGIALLVGGAILLYSYIRQRRLLKDTRAVEERLSRMREGVESAPFELPKNSLLVSMVPSLNELESGIENAVEQKNRSNRMRVELLTNVSHDLKTPLTSIINYADLLCEEELPEQAAGYATSLQEKAYRLKNMVQDVFDLSKATSGNLPVEKQKLDLVKLVRQTLADMDERIQESGLTFKLRIAEEPLMIEADGEKLYRIFQNLFVNALQYSLENSRVHVQLEEQDGYAVAMVKNTSRSELDFDLTEIMERFVRADESRTTEGSGLGLSIVQSFAEASGGEFTIQTDADMFTACVRFPLCQNAVGDTQAENESHIV